MRRPFIWGLLFLGVVPLRAESRVEGLLLARGGPAGVMVQGGWALRGASRESYGPGIPNRYAEVGLRMAVNPAYGEAGVRLEGSPHPMVAFRVEADGFRYPGRPGALRSFPDAGAPFGPEVLKARTGAPGWGTRLSGGMTLQAPLGPLFLRAEGRWLQHHFGGAGPWVFEPELDTLVPTGGWVHHARLAALMKVGDWHLGPCLERTDIPGTGLGRMRVGGLAVRERVLPGGSTLTGFLTGGVNLTDPHRKGHAWAVLGLTLRRP